jgi:hypothetical protein
MVGKKADLVENTNSKQAKKWDMKMLPY